jgi:hypothetical protein
VKEISFKRKCLLDDGIVKTKNHDVNQTAGHQKNNEIKDGRKPIEAIQKLFDDLDCDQITKQCKY